MSVEENYETNDETSKKSHLKVEFSGDKDDKSNKRFY